MAQEREKRRIVLASVLKPVDDPRMLEKMATSLARQSDTEVFVIGCEATASTTPSGQIHLIPIKGFNRISWSRFFAGWKILRIVLQIKPAIFIFNSHELLWVGIVTKILIPVKLIYDVRENYYLNILYGGVHPWILRWPLAFYVRWKEKLLAPAVDHFFLAEKCYETELKFHRSGWTLIENKPVIRHTARTPSSSTTIKLLFSGTLHKSTGVFEAISLVHGLYQLDQNIKLVICGYTPLKETRDEIRKQIGSCEYIEWTGGDQWVSHQKIMDEVQNADFGILSYPDSPHTRGSHPTKLFEYLAMQLPVIVENKWPWIERFSKYDPFVITDYRSPDFPKLLNDLKSKRKPLPEIPGITWADEETKLMKALDQLR